MKALILAAGYAVRLYPLTRKYPKPLLPVGRRPIIEYIVDKLDKIKKLDEIIVVANSKFFAQFKRWASAFKSSKRITLVDDLTDNHTDKRGAVGDMNFVIDKKSINDDLLVVGGDNLFDGELDDFLSFSASRWKSTVIGIYNVQDKDKARYYGIVKLDAENQIIDFKEKPKNPQSTLVAMCLYYFPKDKLGLIKEYLAADKSKHDAAGFYIDWLRKKEPVYGFVFCGRWYDIGERKVYQEAKEKFAE